MSQWNPILITGGFLIAVKKGAATITGQFQADDILNQPVFSYKYYSHKAKIVLSRIRTQCFLDMGRSVPENFELKNHIGPRISIGKV